MALQKINSGRGHWYKLDGKKADGVTTLIGDGMRKKALEYWSANETAGYAVDNWDELAKLSPSKRLDILKKARFESRDEAARRGTEIHDLAERLVHNEEVDVPDEIAGFVESAVRFLDEYKVQPIITETPVAHRAGNYAGTLDLVFRSPLFPDRTFIADWKTNRSGIYGETALQLAAYRYADFYVHGDEEVPMSSLGITDAVAIWIRADGFSVYDMDASPETFTLFKWVSAVARGTKTINDLKREELTL
jgi:hypothetical protein